MRLNKYLARAGITSRRKADKLIEQGRVRVNGKVVTMLGTKIIPKQDKVEVDGKTV
ncbi:MAG: S4 domain-containing protein, partial [Candidatus Aminicenantes bacterium]